jgi:hypothetical protein
LVCFPALLFRLSDPGTLTMATLAACPAISTSNYLHKTPPTPNATALRCRATDMSDFRQRVAVLRKVRFE